MPPRAGLRSFVATACLASLFAACGGSDDPTGPRAAEIKLNLQEIAIDQKDSVQLIPSVVDAQGTLISGVAVTFTSADPAIVTVSNIGVVTSVGPAGTTSLQVKAAGLTRTVPVTVRGVAAKLVVTPSPGTLPQKGTLQLVPRLLDRADAPIPNTTFTYETSAPGIATVSATGVVTSVGPSGLASITVRAGTFAIVTQVAVTQVATRIDVSPTPARVTVGRTRQISVRLRDAVDDEIKGAAFTFTSNAPALITVDAAGTITSVGPLGNASITVRAQGTSLVLDVPVSVVSNGHPDGNASTIITVPGGTYATAILTETAGFVSNLGGVVSAVNLATGAVAPIPSSHGGLSLAVSRSRREVYSAYYQAGQIEIIDASGTPNVVGTIPVPAMALDMVVSADERTLYAGLDNGQVAVIDLVTRGVSFIPAAGQQYLHLSLHPTKPLLYGNNNGSPVFEIDLNAKTQRSLYSAALFTQANAVMSDGKRLYVAGENGAIDEVDTSTGQQVRRISLPSCAAWGMRLTPDDEQLIVACSGGQTLIVERSTGQVLKTIASGGSRRVAISAEGFVALVGQAQSGVAVIR